jgi:RNA polymerase sigma factor FliA
MERHPTSAAQPSKAPDSDAAVKQFDRMIEIYATKERIKWGLPVSVELDLRAYGSLGLSEALSRFDASRGVALATYAEYRVRFAICNGAAAMHRAKRVAASLALHVGSDSGDKWENILNFVEDVAINTGLAAATTDQYDEGADEILLQKERWQLMRSALETLPQRHQQLLRWHFDEVSGDEIADRLGVHKSRVSHLKQQATSLLIRKIAELKRGDDE